MNYRKLKLTILVLSVLAIANIIVFISTFYNQEISKDINDWASFAVYLSGTTNILILIMTLVVTFFIAFRISDIDDERNKMNLEYDNKRFIRELREREYYEVTENLNSVWFALTNENRKNATNDLYRIRMRFVFFVKYKKHLFPNLDANKFEKLDEVLKGFIDISTMTTDTDDSTTQRLLNTFNKELRSFHKEMQEYLTNKNHN